MKTRTLLELVPVMIPIEIIGQPSKSRGELDHFKVNPDRENLFHRIRHNSRIAELPHARPTGILNRYPVL